MKTQQYPIFDMIPVEPLFIFQDSLFNAAFWLAIWAHFKDKPPTWKQFAGLMLLGLAWGASNMTVRVWAVLDTGEWLSSINSLVFNRLNFIWFVYLVTYLALVVRYIRADRAWRTVSRAFITLICLVSIGTFSLFHLVVIGGGLFATRHISDQMVVSMLRSDASVEAIKRVCKDMEFWCAVTEHPEDLKSDSPEVQDALDVIVPWQMHELHGEARVTKPIQHYLSTSKFKLGVFQSIAGYVDKRGKQWIFVFDKKRFDATTGKFVIYASLLISAAHLAWLLGGMFMLTLHENGRIHKYAMRAQLAEKAREKERRRQQVQGADEGTPQNPDGAPAPA